MLLLFVLDCGKLPFTSCLCELYHTVQEVKQNILKMATESDKAYTSI